MNKMNDDLCTRTRASFRYSKTSVIHYKREMLLDNI